MYVCALPETPLRRARYECIARLGYSFYKMTAPRRAVFFVRRDRLWFVKGQSLNENGKSVLPKKRIKKAVLCDVRYHAGTAFFYNRL